MRLLLDANVLISALTDRNQEQRTRAESLFRNAADGALALAIPQCVVFEVVFVLRNTYQRKATEVELIVRDLGGLPNIDIVHELSMERWLSLWPASFAEPVDAAVAAIAIESGRTVASFDRKFLRRLRTVGIPTW